MGTEHEGDDVHRMVFYLPANLQCAGKCTLQWRWWTANSCEPKPDYKCYFDAIKALGWNAEQWWGGDGTCTRQPSSPNTYESGCGEEFANCADIEISAGLPNPTEKPTPAPTAAPTPSSPTPAPTPPLAGSGCVAIPGMNAGATDESCAECATGHQWWPCNSSPKLCECDSDQAPSPSPTPSPTLTAMGCGSCTGCRFKENGVCYTDVDKSYCDVYAGKAVWCGPSLVQGRQAAKAQRHARFLRHTSGVVMIQQESVARQGYDEL